MGPLLDFYSDRAEAHASLMVACLFGLFGLLAVVQILPVSGWWTRTLKIWSSMIYVSFCLTAYHCLQRFGYYANMAEYVYRYIRDNYVPFDRTKVSTEEGMRSLLALENRLQFGRKYRGILHNVLRSHTFVGLCMFAILSILFVIVYLPVIFRAMYLAGGVLCIFLFVFVYLNYCWHCDKRIPRKVKSCPKCGALQPFLDRSLR